MFPLRYFCTLHMHNYDGNIADCESAKVWIFICIGSFYYLNSWISKFFIHSFLFSKIFCFFLKSFIENNFKNKDCFSFLLFYKEMQISKEI